MSIQKTFAIIKPDAVASGHIGGIINEIEKNGFKIVAMKMIHLTKSQAEGFYAVHTERSFFGELVAFMTEGPVVAMILEREDAILHWRKVMGATDPAKAEDGTIRKMFGTGIERNATHGSDAEETAAFETTYFFNAMEIV
jgi:nucleoside-diphosphate kinase